MKPREIKNNIYWIGATDWDRRLFDSLVPLPDGTSYNAYMVKGSEKTAIFDAVDPEKSDIMMKRLENVDQVDYIIIHHAEQDHSGGLPDLLKKYPTATVLCSEKCKPMIVDHLDVDENKVQTVKDGELLSLGNKTIEFIYTPWVHWPETMSTYIKEDKVAFTCDFFGSHLATSDLFVTDEATTYEAAKRYYAEIMMPYRSTVLKNINKMENKEIEFICPSHGPTYNNPKFIIDAYKDWASDITKNEVIIVYTSMHGSTEAMVNRLTARLTELNIIVKRFELTVADVGKLAMELVDATTIIIGTPTVQVGPHPLVFNAANLTNMLKPKLKYAGIIGSYGWATKAVEKTVDLIKNLKTELLEPILVKGYPREKDLEELDNLAKTIEEKHKQIGLI